MGVIVPFPTSLPPNGAAGGSLGGTYPNPTVNVDGSSIESNANALRVKAGGVTNAMLASPVAGVYRHILTQAARATTAAASGTTYFMEAVGSDISTLQVNVQNGTSFLLIPLNAADFAVTGLTTKFMIRAVIPTGGTAPNITCTVGLYALTVAAGSFAIGALQGSGAAVTTPSTNSIAPGTSGDNTFPADGVYGLCYIVSGTPSANFDIYAHLYVRNV